MIPIKNKTLWIVILSLLVGICLHYGEVFFGGPPLLGYMRPADEIVAIIKDGEVFQIKVKKTGELLNLADYKYLNHGVKREVYFDHEAFKESMKGMDYFQKVKFLEGKIDEVDTGFKEFSAGVRRANLLMDDPDINSKLDDLDESIKDIEPAGEEVIQNLKDKPMGVK